METYYHVTYARNLPSIARHGLRVGRQPGLLRAVQSNYKSVYLAEAGGVHFWFQRMMDWAEHDADDPVGDGFIPVVLKIRTGCVGIEDVIGTRDSLAKAVVCRRGIVPGAIRLWNGRAWVLLRGELDLSIGSKWVADEDFEEGGFYALLSAYDSPLMPTF